MRIAIVGGGPGGLFLAGLLSKADPDLSITVFERNSASATFGFGVVFSDRTLDRIHEADPTLREALDTHGRHWETIEVRLKNQIFRCGGNGMAAVSRQVLLDVLQNRATSLGAELRFDSEVTLGDLTEYDLVVAADGGGSKIRGELNSEVRPAATTASARFIWLGTPYMFDGLTFIHERSEHGVFAVHGYPISDALSTFIVETDEQSFRNAGLDAFDVSQAPGQNDDKSISYLQTLFADQTNNAELIGNSSRWGQFVTRKAERWSVSGSQPVVFLGDAVHTAHFSVGSGTKMAMEDAIALSRCLIKHQADLPLALNAYEAEARPPVEAIQRSATPSLSWWEHFGLFHDSFEPWQFAYHFMTRSISDGRLRRRAPEFADDALTAWVEREGALPLSTPIRIGSSILPTRTVTISDQTPAPADQGPGALLVQSMPRTGDTVFLTGISPSSVPEGKRSVGLNPAPMVETSGSSSGDRSDAPEPANNEAPTDVRATWVIAPEERQDDSSEDPAQSVEAVLTEVANLDADRCGAFVVTQGTPFTRSLLAEQIRLRLGGVTVLHEPGFDQDQSRTVILSGRADLVAFSQAAVKPLTGFEVAK